MNARRTAGILSCLLLATGCELGEKSIGDEVDDVGAESTSSSSGDAGASPTTVGMSSTSAGSPSDAESSGDDGETGGAVACDLLEYLDTLQMLVFTCLYVPIVDPQLTHDCVLTTDGPYLALWTRPEQPAAQAIASRDVDGFEQIDWYEHNSGTISTWTCAAIVEAPDCTVSRSDMCLVCVDPGTPTLVCPD